MKTKGTVLIFAYECYPHNRIGSSIGAQRPFQFAKNLSALGWKVIVLCSDHEKRNTLHSKDFKTVVFDLYQTNRLLLSEQDYTIVPLPSLTHYGLSDYLWQKTIVKGLGGTYIGKGFPFSILRKVTTFYNQLFHGDYSWSWVPVAEAFFEDLIKDHKVDIIIGEHSPDAGIILADKCARAYSIPWLADFRDPVLWPFKGLFKFFYRPVIRKIVASSSATINVNSHWSTLDSGLFKKNSHVIMNGYDKAFFETVQPFKCACFTVSYFGSFDHRFQDIIPSLQAFAAFVKQSKNPLQTKLLYRGLSHELFLTSALASGIPSECTDIRGFCEREETISYMKGSHVLLIYSIPPYRVRNVYEQQGFYPGKLFEYIGAGKPMLLIPSDHGLLEDLLITEKRGIAVDSIPEAVLFLQEQFNRWTLGEDAKIPETEELMKYSREGQAVQLDSLLIEVLNKKR